MVLWKAQEILRETTLILKQGWTDREKIQCSSLERVLEFVKYKIISIIFVYV